MPLTTAFRDYLATLVVGGGGSPFNNANTYLGVGDSTTAFSAAHTDIQASTNKLRKAMDASYPQVAGNVQTFRASFSTAEANFAWNEWGLFNASSGGTMMNRKVESLGTKTSAQSWQVTTTITWSTS